MVPSLNYWRELLGSLRASLQSFFHIHAQRHLLRFFVLDVPDAILLIFTKVLRAIQRIRGTSSFNHDISLSTFNFNLLRFTNGFSIALENICVEVAVLDSAIRKGHNSLSMLDSFDPVSFVAGAIGPVHLAVAHALIVDVVSVVDISTFPGEGAHTIFLIVHIFSFKTVALRVIHYFSPN